MTTSASPFMRSRPHISGPSPLRLLGALTAVILAIGLLAAPSQAVTDPPIDPPTPSCPAVYPADDLTQGQAVTGLTVSAGSTPEGFTGTYVGSIADGIAPGVDMLVFKMSGSKITTADGAVDYGIWGGMSGSPVYAADGRLIGAVGYGLAYAPSDYAGVTPAEHMYQISRFNRPAPARVALPQAMARRMGVAAASAQASAGFGQLPTPIQVSTTLSQRELESLARRTGHASATLVKARRGGGTAAAGTGTFLPGGNLAVLAADGSGAMTTMGTVTAVCGDTIIGFGHPVELTGPSTLAIADGDVVLVEKDLDGSFKVGNVGAPIGRLNHDRLAAIWGTTASLPDFTTISSSIDTPFGTRQGSTRAFGEDWVVFALFNHISAESTMAMDSVAVGGTAALDWTIRLRREDGTPATLTRHNVYSARSALGDEYPWDVAADVGTILDNPYENVRIDSIGVNATISEQYLAYKIKQVEYLRGGAWHPFTANRSLRLRAGKVLRLRVTVSPAFRRSGTEYRFEQTVTIPRSQPVGSEGTLTVQGLFEEWYDDFDEEGAGGDDEWGSLEAMLAAMAKAPRNDTILTSLAFLDPSAAEDEDDWEPRVVSSTTRTAPSTVTGSHDLSITVKADKKPKKKKKNKKPSKKKNKGKKGKKGKKAGAKGKKSKKSTSGPRSSTKPRPN